MGFRYFFSDAVDDSGDNDWKCKDVDKDKPELQEADRGDSCEEEAAEDDGIWMSAHKLAPPRNLIQNLRDAI